MKRVPDASGESLIPFVHERIEPGSVVLTDAWGGSHAVPKLGCPRIQTNLSDSGDPAPVVLPGVPRIASLRKRWRLGAHQKTVSAKPLDYSPDEYTFRFNRRPSQSRGKRFYRWVQRAAAVQVVPSQGLVGGIALRGPQDVGVA